MKAICLLSGGMDSAVAMFAWLRDHPGGTVIPLLVQYGQRHKVELLYAKAICRHLGVEPYTVAIDMHPPLRSSLVGVGDIPDIPSADIGRHIPSTFVPGRNAIFLALAGGYADTAGADTVVTGFNAVDYSGYPDCRREFVDSMERSLSLALAKPIRVFTPLISKTKADIIRLGITLEVPFEYTWSCYSGGCYPCGFCDSCKIRSAGFKDVGVPDPAVGGVIES